MKKLSVFHTPIPSGIFIGIILLCISSIVIAVAVIRKSGFDIRSKAAQDAQGSCSPGDPEIYCKNQYRDKSFRRMRITTTYSQEPTASQSAACKSQTNEKLTCATANYCQALSISPAQGTCSQWVCQCNIK